MVNLEREELFRVLQEIDAIAMQIVKHLLAKKKVSDVENLICHSMNNILENHRVVVYSLTRDFDLTTGSALRNLLENWANLDFVLTSKKKKEKYATAISDKAISYAQLLNDLVEGNIETSELYEMSSWTNSTLAQRLERLGDGAVFQYELLSRHVHADMWAAVNSVVANKHLFWNVLLSWGVEFSCHTILLVDKELILPDNIKSNVKLSVSSYLARLQRL